MPHPALVIDYKCAERPSLLKLFLSYLRVTNLTFGGGTITMAALHTELVSLRKWLTQEKYATVYALARITPGTNMLAFCAGTAWETARLARGHRRA